MTHTFVGALLPTRQGQPCRLVNTWRGRGPHNVRVEFADGHRVVCPVRCTRKIKSGERREGE